MSVIHFGATLDPHFRDFLPGWVIRQPWFVGGPELVPIGYFRLEDPAGEVGIETHLLSDGSTVHQVPLTYRGAPLTGAAAGLVAEAQHSVLGARWIYDATVDPVWRAEMVRLVRTEGASEPSSKRGVAPADARGRRAPDQPSIDDRVAIDLDRTISAGEPAVDALGIVMGTWSPGGVGTPAVAGRLAVIRTAGS